MYREVDIFKAERMTARSVFVHDVEIDSGSFYQKVGKKFVCSWNQTAHPSKVIGVLAER